MIEIRIAHSNDSKLFETVAEAVFDNAVEPDLVQEFLEDARHHIAVAISDGCVVGFASGVDYVHPDKPRELWINEVGVGREYRGRGLGAAVLRCLLEHAKAIGCSESWVLTDESNMAAQALYSSFRKDSATRGVSRDPGVLFTFRLG